MLCSAAKVGSRQSANLQVSHSDEIVLTSCIPDFSCTIAVVGLKGDTEKYAGATTLLQLSSVSLWSHFY